jgi:hypothetical protein
MKLQTNGSRCDSPPEKQGPTRTHLHCGRARLIPQQAMPKATWSRLHVFWKSIFKHWKSLYSVHTMQFDPKFNFSYIPTFCIQHMCVWGGGEEARDMLWHQQFKNLTYLINTPALNFISVTWDNTKTKKHSLHYQTIPLIIVTHVCLFSPQTNVIWSLFISYHIPGKYFQLLPILSERKNVC